MMNDFYGAYVDVIGNVYRATIERKMAELKPKVDEEEAAARRRDEKLAAAWNDVLREYHRKLESYADAVDRYHREVEKTKQLPFWKKKVYPAIPEKPNRPQPSQTFGCSGFDYGRSTREVFADLGEMLKGINDVLLYHIPMDEAIKIGLGE